MNDGIKKNQPNGDNFFLFDTIFLTSRFVTRVTFVKLGRNKERKKDLTKIPLYEYFLF